MDAWEQWWNMAQESFVAAQSLEQLGIVWSAASRAYYAAYQAATTLLLYARLVPPEDREAWSHEATPALLRNVSDKMLNRARQRDLEERLRSLYELRLIADYQGEEAVSRAGLRAAVRDAAFVLRIVRTIVTGE